MFANLYVFVKFPAGLFFDMIGLASAGRGVETPPRQPAAWSQSQCLPCRRDGHQTERLPGVHPVAAAERTGPGPGRKGHDDAGRGPRLPRPLQQLRTPVSQRREMSGEAQGHRLRLRLLCVRRAILRER